MFSCCSTNQRSDLSCVEVFCARIINMVLKYLWIKVKMRHPTFFSFSPLFLPHRMSRGSCQKNRVVFYSLPFQYRMSTLRPSLFVCVHAGSSDCAFPVTLARVGCFDKQTLSVAGAACTNSREALERSDSKCLGTVVVFQSPCSPAANTPPHLF